MITIKLLEWLPYEIQNTGRLVSADAAFVRACVKDLPHNISRKLIGDYVTQYTSKTALTPARSANIALRKKCKPLKRILRHSAIVEIGALYSDSAREQAAQTSANHCVNLITGAKNKGDYLLKCIKAYRMCMVYAGALGITQNIKEKCVKVEQYESALVRLMDADWWDKQLDKHARRIKEHCNIVAGFVRAGSQEYASNTAVGDFRRRRADNAHFLSMMDVENINTGEVIPLEIIAAKTTSNPVLRRIELMTRCRGLEDLANKKGYESLFITLTAPSKYHANSKKFINCAPVDTHKFMCEQWAKSRAAIARKNIDWFGVRVVEPHADATPHWHMLVFVAPSDNETLTRIIKKYAFEIDGEEKGAAKNRIDIKKIDPTKGSAVGYIAKYICKNIDAATISTEQDLKSDKGQTLGESMERVLSWSSLWKVRQFQFFGAASVGVWRELRRLKEKFTSPEFALAESLRAAADSGDWQIFTEECAKVGAKLHYKEIENKYGEIEKTPVGVLFGDLVAITRAEEFKLTMRKNKNADTAKRGQGESRDSGATWTRVNNCTPLPVCTQTPGELTKNRALLIQKIKTKHPFLTNEMIALMAGRILEQKQHETA